MESGKNYAVNPAVKDAVLACYEIVLRYNGALSETAAEIRAKFPACFVMATDV